MSPDITPDEVKQRLENGITFHFIDVREEWEYEEANIGAQLLPLGDLPTRIEEIIHLKEEEVVVHCKSGKRSGQAKKFLTSRGFTKVRSMEGGIEAYLNS